MRNLFLALTLFGLALPAYSQAADNLGVYLAAQGAAINMATPPGGPGLFFNRMHRPPMFKKGRKHPKIEYLDNGNIRVDNKEFTPVLKDNAVSTK